MLKPLLDGSAQRLLEHVSDGEGLLNRHRLVAEHDLTTAGRKRSLLLEVLAQTFKGNVRESLDEFETKIRRYERSCKKVLLDRVKIAVVQMGFLKPFWLKPFLAQTIHCSSIRLRGLSCVWFGLFGLLCGAHRAHRCPTASRAYE